MTGSRIRAGFVGGGWVTCSRHIPSVIQHTHIQPVGLVSEEGRSTWLSPEEMTTKFGLSHFGHSMSDDWFKDSVDLAVIGTPPETHRDLVLQALALGKHVLVEKPFAMSTAEADEMVQAATDAGLVLGVVHNFQFSRAAQRARDLLDSGALGELRGVFGFQCSNHKRRLPRWYKELPLGLFTDESPHLLYLVRAFLGDVRTESIFVGPALGPGDNTPHAVSASFTNDNGLTGSVYMTFVSALSEWQFMVFGTQRTVMVDVFRDILIEIPDDKGHLSADVMRTTLNAVGTHLRGVVTSGVRHVTNKLDYGNQEVVRRMYASITQDIPLKAISGDDGRHVVAVMEQITQQRGW